VCQQKADCGKQITKLRLLNFWVTTYEIFMLRIKQLNILDVFYTIITKSTMNKK